MYCKNCNAFNPEENRFCSNCGAPLEEQKNENAFGEQPPFGEQPQNNGYTQPVYSEPYSQFQNEPEFKNTGSIVAIILNVVFFNIIGLILAVLSLTSFNDYESALRQRNFTSAREYKDKSKRYAKIADILAIINAVIGFLAIIGWIVFVAVVGFSEAGDIPYGDAFNEFEQFVMMLSLR